MSTTSWIAVVLAALSSFLIGAAWYGPLLGRVWMRASGVTREAVAGASLGKVLGLSLVLQLVAAVVLAMFLGAEPSMGFAVAASASVGLFWIAPALGVIYLFEQRPLSHWIVNAGYHVLAFTVMGVILGAWL